MPTYLAFSAITYLITRIEHLNMKLEDDSSSETDINSIDLFTEINALKLHFPENQSNDPQTLLQCLLTNDLILIFSNSDSAKNIAGFSYMW